MGKSVLFSVILVIFVLWKPAYSDKCSIGCKGSSSAPTFLSGHKYNYGVEGTVTIYLTGADKQETSVKLLGQVGVTPVGNCVHELNVQSLAISGPDGKKHQSPPGLDKPVRFTLQDGRLDAEICAEDGDTRRSLNIKRAIISLLQTEQRTSTQVDIFGTCPTDVTSSKEGGAVLIHRTRDLSRCGYREQGKNDIFNAVYNPNAEIKDSQVLQSVLNVESKVNNGVPEKVSATEEYLYRPFSVGENGARAKVFTKLTLTGKTQAANAPSQCTESRTIIFENPHGISLGSSNLQASLSAVKETARTLTTEASSKSAGNFAQLVRVLRTTNKNDLINIFNQVRGNDVEKRVFLDGLLRAGTGYSVEASITILKSKALNTIEEKLVYLSLGNARHVNNEALKAAASLLDQPNIPKEVYLGAGALGGAYCREHKCHNSNNPGIAALSQKFGAKLQNCKPKTKVEEDNVVAILKGIRNIRHLEDSLVDKLHHCVVDNNVKARVRVAALEAIHADPCTSKLHKAAIDLLKNRQLDSEIRIKAYLAVIECPCAQSATEIKNLLDSEPVHQVGHFITTSLRHIRTSSNPDKFLARHHYGNIRTPNKFNLDERKYSFYREVSYNVDALGAGGNLEQTVIYSQDSFLPRSASLNITAELFGHSLNLLEVGGRQGNLDRVAEHFFGPKGFFQHNLPQKLSDVLIKLKDFRNQAGESLTRTRRSVKSEIDTFDKNLKAEATSYNNELDLDIYVKLFGTDAVFLSLGDDKGFNFDKVLDELLNFVNGGIDKIKHFQQELRANLLFIDAELAYPTLTGLPLKLDLTGAITTRVELSTNVDIRQCLKSLDNAKLDIKFVPSTDIEIAGQFLVDADAVSTGLKVFTNLHTSTGGHLIAKVLENGRGFDLQLGLPIEKQEILTASSDLVYVTIEKGQKEKHTALKVDTDRKEYADCFDQFAGLTGLTICGELSVPFQISGPDAQASISKFIARFPLTGPSKVKLVIEKNDLRGYHIKGLYRFDTTAGKRNFEVLFDAEGSKNRRTHLTGELVANRNAYSVKLDLESPIRVLSGEVSLLNKPSELSALIKAKDQDNEYYGRVGFTIQGNDRRSVFKPFLEYQVPKEQKKNINIDGQVIREINGPNVKYSLENVKAKLPNSEEPLEISGQVSHKSTLEDFDFDIKVKDKVLLKGGVKNRDVNLEFQNTLNPYINFKIIGHFENGQTIHNDIDLIYGGDLKNSQNRVVLNQLIKYHKKSSDDFNIITKNKFEIYAVPLKLKLDADIDPKKLDIDIEGQYIDKKAKFDLEARTHIKKPKDYSVKFTADIDKEGIEIFAKRDIVSNDKSNLENYISIKNAGKYELSGVLLHKTRSNDYNVGAVGHFKITGTKQSEDIKFDVGVIENANLYSSHAKLSGSKGELIDYLLKITRGANPSGQLKFILKDTVAANGNFKVTDSDGKGNGMIIVDFKTTQRKIKADLKFIVKDPVYSADIDVFLNFEKDANDKIHLSTNTKTTKSVIDSKNNFEYGGKKSEINVYKEGAFEKAGKNKASIEVVLPNERCLTLKFDRDVTVTDGSHSGHAELSLSDATKRGGSASSISYKGKATNTNFDKEIINYEGQVEIKLKDGKHLQNAFELKLQPKGDKAQFDWKTEVTGNILSKPASAFITYTYDKDDVIVDDTYKAAVKYGDDYRVDVSGVWVVRLFEKGEKKYLDDFTVVLHLPFEKAHDIKWVSKVLYQQPENADVAEYALVESIHLDADQYKLDANGKLGLKEGVGSVKLLLPQVDPLIFDVNYKNKEEGEKKGVFTELKAKYGKGKSASISADSWFSQRDNTFVLKAHAPQAEKLKKLEITAHSTNPSPDTYTSSLIIDIDDRVYKSENSVVLSKAHPVLDLKYTSAQKTSRVFVKGSSLSSTQGKIEIKIENVRDINLDLITEGNLQKDNVAFKVVANSDKLGCKNYVVDISSKDSGSGKRLEFKAINDNKNVLSGSTSFISKQEGQKTIIEGSGSVKVKEEQKSANFKYIRTILTEGNEKGVETFFNVAIGERSYVAESRVTNFEYKNSYIYCEEKKQCSHAELQSKIDVSKPGILVNVINAGFDLRKLGIAPEWGLQIREEASPSHPPHYTLDLHADQHDRKYHLRVYNTPEFGHGQSGITIQLPQRTLALESTLTYPTSKNLPFPIKGELSLDLNKNKAGHKTGARFLVDLNIDNDKKQTVVAEFGFSHPRIRKEALVKFSGEIERPEKNTVKVETHASISHPTLGADRQTKLLLEANPTHVKLLIDTPLVKVIELDGSATIKDNHQQSELKFSLLQGKPVTVKAVVKDYQYYEFTSEESDRKLSVIGHLEPEKRVDFSADLVLSGDKKNIIHGALFLQDNTVKSDYGVSKDSFDYFFKAVKSDLNTLEDRIKQLAEKANKDFKDVTHRVEPTLKDLEKAYREDLESLYKEISDDKTLKEISHAFNDFVQFVAKFIDDILKALKPLVDKITDTYVQTTKKIEELYEKQIEPELKKLYTTVSTLLKEYFEGLLDVVAHFAALFTDFFEKHKVELKELTDSLTEIFKDLTRLLVAQLKEFRVRVDAIWKEVSEQIKELPLINIIKEKWQELAVPDQAIALLQQGYEALRPLLPTQETRDFLDALNTYVQKKLRQQKCDDNKELRVIYQKLATAITSLVQFVRAQLGQIVAPGSVGFNAFAFSPAAVQSAPSLGAHASFSVLKQLLQGDVPDPLALFRAYRPRSLNPLDEIPAKLRAVIVNGQHIFTFDGRHLTFPGSCRYVLVHDHVDRNFTLAIQLQAGQPKALALQDQSGSVIEIKDNGQVTLNGAVHSFPLIENDIFAFKQANGRVGIGSRYGLMVFCTSKLEVCYIEVSGFYLGKLRGLLGDGNNEPYDDFRLPNGKICTSESEFGNAYRLSRSCPQVQVPEHSHHQLHEALPPACELVFGGTSRLRPLGLFLNVAPFRQACIHAVASDSANALHQACDIGRGYAALALTGLLPAVLPDECAQCTDADKPVKVGDSYELKLPNKQADIIVLVETTKDNEKNYKELVVPLVGQVIDNLKSKQITDIKVHLLGITSRMPYPLFYDADLKLQKPKVEFTDASRYDLLPTDGFNVTGSYYEHKFYKAFIDLLNSIKIEFGLTNVVAGYNSILELPLRPGAVKHAISVVGQDCHQQFFLLEAARSIALGELFENNAYTLSIVTPTPLLKLTGGNAAQVVGYTDNSVILLGDKRIGKESEALRPNLWNAPNACIDFVEDTDGYVFSASNYFALDAAQQKQFLQTAAHSISHKLLHQNLVQECICTFVDPFRARSVCFNKERKEAAHRRK